MDPDEAEITPATARLPGLHIEVTHRCPADGDAEQISANLSFAAFGHAFEAADPVEVQSSLAAGLAARLPWPEAARMMGLPSTLPWAIATAQPRPPGGDG